MQKAFLSIIVAVLLLGGGWLAQKAIWPTQSEGTKGQTEQPKPNPNERETTSSVQPSTEPDQQKQAESFAIRGVVEGFYGAPWSMAQRVNMLNFMERYQFNTYVYAPKDDPYQRKDWDKPYPADQLAQLKDLVQAAKKNNIRFVYSISPGIPAPLPDETITAERAEESITFSSTNDRAKLLAKLDQLRSIGINNFMLSFDDVEKKLKAPDQDAYLSYQQAHIELANAVLQEEKKKEASFQLWFAPTVYYGVKDNPYWLAIRENLDPSIPVIWTGSWVLNEAITSEQADQVAKLIGRKPLIWDNYPVNDYTYVVKKAPQLLLGPLENRSGDLGEHSVGLIANPMIQPESSKIALATVAQYLQKPYAYDPEAAWTKAIADLNGILDRAAFEMFARFAEESSLRETGNPAFVSLTDSYWKEQEQTARQTYSDKIRDQLNTVSQLPQQLHATVKNQQLLAEIDPWLKKLGQEASLALAALDYAELSSADPVRMQKRQELQAGLDKLKSDPLKIGSELVKFVEDALSK